MVIKRWVRSSEEERLPYEQKVVGSSPAAPTKGKWPGSSVGRALD